MPTIFATILILLGSARADIYTEIYSDLTTSGADESRALSIKNERYWQRVLQAGQEMQLESHLALLSDTEKVIANLPPANVYVREALSEALMRLRRADFNLLMQGAHSTELASERLASPAGMTTGSFSFFSQKNIFALAIRRFVGEGQYSEKLHEQVTDRQAGILPLLRGTADVTGSVLTDCQLTSKRSFDVLKYDLYNTGVPKTPEVAEDVANRLIEAAAASRHRFTSFVVDTVTSIADDTKGKDDRATATVMQSSLEAHMMGLKVREGSSAGLDQIISL